MPCYRCGVRQTDPERGKSPWRRGVLRDQLVLVCPACQEAGDWTADLESCPGCGTVHLIRRLGQVECLDCGLVREPAPVLVPSLAGGQEAEVAVASARSASGGGPGASGAAGRDAALAEEVGRALERLLGRRLFLPWAHSRLGPAPAGIGKVTGSTDSTVRRWHHILDAKVRDVMTPGPIGVDYYQTIGETARTMRDWGIGAVLVVAGQALYGLVTDRDLVVRAVAEAKGPDGLVGPLSSGNVIGVDVDADAGEAGRLMHENHVGRLPVLEDGQVTGMVTLGDLAMQHDHASALAAITGPQPVLTGCPP